jgi:Na+-translocating ferredoxin:NAD+ oxidoreductase RnfG subunit
MLSISSLFFLAVGSLLPTNGYGVKDFSDGEISQAVDAVRGGYPAADEVAMHIERLTSHDQDRIAESSGSRWSSDTLVILVPQMRDSLVGYAVLDNVRGKDRLITYLVMVTKAFEVQGLEIITYREPYGQEVGHESWRTQFIGKKPGNKIRVGREIRNISGATISARAVTAGVSRILQTLELLRDRLPT